MADAIACASSFPMSTEQERVPVRKTGQLPGGYGRAGRYTDWICDSRRLQT